MKRNNFVQEIWNLCHILRDDGITYYQYVSELSYLLFLKVAQENDSEFLIPAGYRWAELETRDVDGLLGFYQRMLTHLGATADNAVVRAVYAFPTTAFSHSENLKAVIDGIAKLRWHEVGHDRFGEIYSGLIDKSAKDARSGAGQYFTPRPLIDSIIRTIKPRLGEVIQDPAAGSGGFLVSADRFLREQHTIDAYAKNPPRYQGVEIEKNSRRICLMNTFLHGLNAEIIYGDALTDDVSSLASPDIIVANPPFGTRMGSKRPLRKDISFPTSNKQLAFLQHIYNSLGEGGRAAVVLPDNVLFEEGIGRSVRRELMMTCDLQTVLRLPTGIFTGTGIKTNVLFFEKKQLQVSESTRHVWFYDLRTDMPHFGKRIPLTTEHFRDFEAWFGYDSTGKIQRDDNCVTRRSRCFTREEVAERNDNLDISWLRLDRTDVEEEAVGPGYVADAIVAHLRLALSEVESVADELLDGGEAKS